MQPVVIATIHSTTYPGQLLLPEGFTLPPLPYLVGLVVALGLVGYGLYVRRPAVEAAVVVAFAPWMAVGSALHVLYVLGTLPPAIAPLAGTPSVYLSVGAIAGGFWLVGVELDRSGVAFGGGNAVVPIVIGASGFAALLAAAGATLAVGAAAGTLQPVWPAIAALLTLPVTAVAWLVLVRIAPGAKRSGAVGVLVVFGHALDGVSTAIGVDVLGFGERTPLSQLILEVGAALPTASLIGSGWLFVLVKLAVAGLVVALFDDFVRESPAEASLLLGLVAAVGLGPGVHNLLLFAVAGV
ncbi:putative membrane protein [Halalkaliarchaeum sp. AArc-CO]|uniref:DUF63 family protein n=1 Tax=Halalkaliarchaeum sp. AArc-CO TaxID=2866381 RepID=UPI00217DEDCE|nr:DUF63 family protein [Halalkaliarchaeum sp. AArc-CO]UWG50866.1 putative membrane protein [Halalkaliarchaeum sp. AArc-CO]